MAFRINEKVCNGCDACVTACPTKAISGVQDEVHSIDQDICVSCGLCINLCKNFAIRSGGANELLPYDEWPIPHFDTKLCNGCSACLTLCPMYAIKISEPKYRGDTGTYAELIDTDLCIGCGKCSEHCPVGAVTMVKRLVACDVKEEAK